MIGMADIELRKKEIANVAGYSYHRLNEIDRDLPADRKLFVQTEGGKYDLALFVQRWVDYNVKKANDVSMSLEDAKAVHEQVKIEKTQLEVDRMRGILVDVNEVRRLWGNVVNTVVQNMMRLPSKIAGQVYMVDNMDLVSGIIDKEIREVLENIANTPLPEEAEAVSDDDDDDETEE